MAYKAHAPVLVAPLRPSNRRPPAAEWLAGHACAGRPRDRLALARDAGSIAFAVAFFAFVLSISIAVTAAGGRAGAGHHGRELA